MRFSSVNPDSLRDDEFIIGNFIVIHIGLKSFFAIYGYELQGREFRLIESTRNFR